MNNYSDLLKYTWRSPLGGSHGFVSYVKDEDGDFFGCGETGAIWKSKDAFYKNIDSIIKKYPHRKYFYKKVDGEWLPNDNEPENINQLIDKEEMEELEDFIRE